MMKISNWFVILLIITSFIITNCDYYSDFDDQDNCGKAFTESEPNDSTTDYHNLNIYLRNGCTITISGTIGPSGTDDDDYFLINSGLADNINVSITWDNTFSFVDILLYDYSYTSWAQESSTGSSSGGAYFAFTPRSGVGSSFASYYIRVNKPSDAVTSNYTLTIYGSDVRVN